MMITNLLEIERVVSSLLKGPRGGISAKAEPNSRLPFLMLLYRNFEYT